MQYNAATHCARWRPPVRGAVASATSIFITLPEKLAAARASRAEAEAAAELRRTSNRYASTSSAGAGGPTQQQQQQHDAVSRRPSGIAPGPAAATPISINSLQANLLAQAALSGVPVASVSKDSNSTSNKDLRGASLDLPGSHTATSFALSQLRGAAGVLGSSAVSDDHPRQGGSPPCPPNSSATAFFPALALAPPQAADSLYATPPWPWRQHLAPASADVQSDEPLAASPSQPLSLQPALPSSGRASISIEAVPTNPAGTTSQRRLVHKRVSDLFSQHRGDAGMAARGSGAESASAAASPTSSFSVHNGAGASEAEDDVHFTAGRQPGGPGDGEPGAVQGPGPTSAPMRLVHRPGPRRLPNRHASMPTVSGLQPGVCDDGGVCASYAPISADGGLAAAAAHLGPGPGASSSGAHMLGGQPGMAAWTAGAATAPKGLQRQGSESMSMASLFSGSSSFVMPLPGFQVHSSMGMGMGMGIAFGAQRTGAGGVTSGSFGTTSASHVQHQQQMLLQQQQQLTASRLAVLHSAANGRLSFEQDPMGTAGPHGAGGPSAFLMSTQRSLRASESGRDRTSFASGRHSLMAGGAAASGSQNLVSLHRAVERLMLQDSSLYAKVGRAGGKQAPAAAAAGHPGAAPRALPACLAFMQRPNPVGVLAGAAGVPATVLAPAGVWLHCGVGATITMTVDQAPPPCPPLPPRATPN